MSMTSEQAAFYRAELARAPGDFANLDAGAIEKELDARWERQKSGGVVMLEDKLTSREAEENGVVFCGGIRREGKEIFLYKKRVAAERKVDAVPAFKRARTSSAAASSSDRSMVDLECFLLNFKNETLRDMCEDMQLAVSGNKGELIRRIIQQMTE